MIAERAVLRLINVPLTDGQFDALVSFTYNLGGRALQRSTLRRKINREKHAEVPEQFMRLKSGLVAGSCAGWFGDGRLRLISIRPTLPEPCIRSSIHQNFYLK